MIFAPVIVVLAISSLLHYQREREEALSMMSLLASQTGEVIERAIQHDMVLSDFEHIQSVFDDLGEDPRIGSLQLLDPSGRVIFSPNGESTGQVLSNQDSSCQPCHSKDASERPAGIVTSADDGLRFLRSMHPIENVPECHQCHNSEQKLIGVLLTEFSIEPIEQMLAGDLRNNLVWWAVTALLIILLVNFAIRRWVLTRIDNLHAAMEGFGRLLQPQELPEGPQDEIGHLSHTYNVMAQRISKRDAENQALSLALQKRMAERGQLLKQIITVQEEERIRVARELHDEFGQSLNSTILQIDIAKRQLANDPNAPVEHLDQAKAILKDATDQMYDLISGLRPPVIDDLGLEAAFRSLAKHTLEPAGVDFSIETHQLKGRLPSEIETVLYRVFQEAITNVLRHARASSVTLKLTLRDQHVIAEMTDNGLGVDLDRPPEVDGRSSGLGLVGMSERVEQCGGEFLLSSQPGEGTRILVRLPLESI